MITIEQCRGARGLIGWTQQDLADASGLSKTAINNFEKRHSDIKAESIKAIRMAFESMDIEFLEQDGVRKKSENLRLLKGPMALGDILDDIQETAGYPSSEILIHNIDQNFIINLPTQKLFAHMELIKTHNITERILCTEGIKTLLSQEDQCRWLPEDMLKNAMPTIIYGKKVAFQLYEQSMFVLINSAEASEVERKRFETLWAEAKIPAGAAQKSTPKKNAS